MSALKKDFIHETALVEKGASTGSDCDIGPFCLVGSNVRLGNRVKLHSHVVVTGNTIIGGDTVIWPFASIGHQPQDLKYRGEKSNLIIGKRNKLYGTCGLNRRLFWL